MNKLKRTISTSVVLVCLLSFFAIVSCKDKDALNKKESELPEIDENGLTKDITDVIPIEIVNEMKKLGMPIHGGNKPPLLTNFIEEIEDELRSSRRISESLLPVSIQSLNLILSKPNNSRITNQKSNSKHSDGRPSLTFGASPVILLNGNNEGDSPGKRFVDTQITLKNQDNKKLTIDYYENEGGGLALTEGLNANIVGNDCDFTVFATMEYFLQSGSRAKMTTSISGTVTPDGIENFHKSLFMLDNYGNPNKDLIEVGKGRVFHDSDRFSPRYGTEERTWYSNLPPCPCTYEEVKQLANTNKSSSIGCFDGSWSICGNASQKYHYGATYEVRWSPREGGKPGQQCTYDANGILITGGFAAGSPDKVSPNGCGIADINIDYWGHYSQDVRTWENLPAVQYLREWPANNIKACKNNSVTGVDHMLELVGQMTAPYVVEIIKSANENKYNIPKDLRRYILGENISISKEKILEYLRNWKTNVDTSWLEGDLKSSLDQAIKNLE